MADADLIIRVDPELKQDFDWACGVADSTASQVLRQYMCGFVSKLMAQEASQVVIEEPGAAGPQFLYNKEDAAEVLSIKKKIFLRRLFIAAARPGTLALGRTPACDGRATCQARRGRWCFVPQFDRQQAVAGSGR